MSKYEVISGPYFPAHGLNMERYFVSLPIQSECGEIRTRNYSVFGNFSRSKKAQETFPVELVFITVTPDFTPDFHAI